MEYKPTEQHDKDAHHLVAAFIAFLLLLISAAIRFPAAASLPSDATVTGIILLILDITFATGGLYLLFLLAFFLFRKARAKPKPHTYPGFKGLALSFAISAVVVPTAVFTAVAITNNDQEPMPEFSPPPTPTAVPLPTETLDPQEDLAHYRELVADDSTLNAFLTCWNSIGQDEGIRERIDARDHLRVRPRGEGFWVDIRSDASQESKHILQLYGSTQTHFDMYILAYIQLIAVLRENFVLPEDEILVDQQATILLMTHRFTDEEWLAIRQPAYDEFSAVHAYHTDMTALMEILMPGCSHS